MKFIKYFFIVPVCFFAIYSGEILANSMSSKTGYYEILPDGANNHGVWLFNAQMDSLARCIPDTKNTNLQCSAWVSSATEVSNVGNKKNDQLGIR